MKTGYEKEYKWTQKDRDWSEYPVGTKAAALMGGYWIKTERGWKWFSGSTFPQPGGDASGLVCVPQEDVNALADHAFLEAKEGSINFWGISDDDPEVLYWKKVWIMGYNAANEKRP